MNHRRQLCAVAALAAAPLVLTAVPDGVSAATAAPSVAVSPAFGPPASSATVTGTGFCSAGTVRLRFAGKLVGRAAVTGAGGFHAKITVPPGALPGTTAVRAVEAGCPAANASFLVRSNVQQAGDTAVENYLSPANVAQLAPAWTIARNRVLSRPSIVDGIAYYGSYNGDETGATLFAADARTGAPKWAIGAGPVVAQPTVVNGTVYFGSRAGGASAVDAATGAVRWSVGTAGPVDQPVRVVNGVAYVAADNTGETHGVARLLAVDAKTGAVRWEFDSTLYFPGPPSIVNGVVYFSTAEHSAYAVDAETGALIWHRDTSGYFTSAATVYRGLVFVGSDDGTFHALDVATGAERWSRVTAEGTPHGSFGPDVVYLQLSDGLHAFDPRTGRDRGIVPVAVGTGRNGVIYELAGTTLIARDDTTGALLFSTTLPGGGNGITVVNGAVYVATETGLVVYTVGGALPRA